jgi:hypothetical protein
MSGYFYNDARVRELYRLKDVRAAVSQRPRLVLCGPRERPKLEASGLDVHLVTPGPRGSALLRVSPAPDAPLVPPGASPS